MAVTVPTRVKASAVRRVTAVRGQTDLRMDLALAIIIVLAALGLLLFWAVTLVERWLIPWHISQRQHSRP